MKLVSSRSGKAIALLLAGLLTLTGLVWLPPSEVRQAEIGPVSLRMMVPLSSMIMVASFEAMMWLYSHRWMIADNANQQSTIVFGERRKPNKGYRARDMPLLEK